MPTLLVTRKMSPELAARVQASVDGRRAPPGAKLAPRATSLLRIGATTTIVVLAIWLGLSLHRAHRALEARRVELSERVQREAAELGPDEHAAVTRVLPWLPLFTGAHPGDLVADELRPAGAFASLLAWLDVSRQQVAAIPIAAAPAPRLSPFSVLDGVVPSNASLVLPALRSDCVRCGGPRLGT